MTVPVCAFRWCRALAACCGIGAVLADRRSRTFHRDGFELRACAVVPVLDALLRHRACRRWWWRHITRSDDGSIDHHGPASPRIIEPNGVRFTVSDDTLDGARKHEAINDG